MKKDNWYIFRSEEKMENLIKQAELCGYKPAGGTRATFKDVKNRFRRNKIFVMHTYFNHLNSQYEYIFSTKQIESRHYGIKFR